MTSYSNSNVEYLHYLGKENGLPCYGRKVSIIAESEDELIMKLPLLPDMGIRWQELHGILWISEFEATLTNSFSQSLNAPDGYILRIYRAF